MQAFRQLFASSGVVRSAVAPLTMILLVTALITAGCGNQQPGTPPDGSSENPEEASHDGPSVALVLSDKVGVNPFLQLMADGLERAKGEFDIETRIVESEDWSAIEDNLRAVAAEEQWDLIITNSFESAEPLEIVAGEYPDQDFAIMDTVVPADNVRSVAFKEHEAAYLLGAAAGMVTESDVVGFVGPVDNPFMHRWHDNMKQAVKDVNPGADFIANWVGDFTNVARAKELALAQADQGADVILAVAGAGNFGVFEAAKEKDFLTTGQDVNQSVHDPEHIFLSQIKNLDDITYRTIKDYVEGNWDSGVYVYGLEEGGVGLSHLANPDLERHPVLTDAVMNRLEELRQKIIEGEIEPVDPTSGS